MKNLTTIAVILCVVLFLMLYAYQLAIFLGMLFFGNEGGTFVAKHFFTAAYLFFPIALIGALWVRYSGLRRAGKLDIKIEAIRFGFLCAFFFTLFSPAFLPEKFANPLLVIGTPATIFFYFYFQRRVDENRRPQ